MAEKYNFDEYIDRSRLNPELKKSLSVVLRKNIMHPISKTRRTTSSNSLLTQKFRTVHIVAMLEDLTVSGPFKRLSLEGIRQKHIGYLMSEWLSKKLSRGTIENKLSYLGALLIWIGKPELKVSAKNVPEVSELPARTWVAGEDKTWTGTKINVADVVSKILSEDIHVGTQLLFQLNFGLRAREAMLLRPAKALCTSSGEDFLDVVHGTKGGRPRRVPVETAVQKKLIEEARKITNQKNGSLIPDHYTLDQWLRRYYYVLQKHGITKRELGFTGHGLRAEYMSVLYTKLTGLDTPVNGGEKPDIALLNEVRKAIVERAGHTTPYKSGAYIGSHQQNKHKRTSAITDEEIVKALEECGNNRTHAAKRLGLSRAMLYRRMARISPLTNDAYRSD